MSVTALFLRKVRRNRNRRMIHLRHPAIPDAARANHMRLR
jgi:hypothetical protein